MSPSRQRNFLMGALNWVPQHGKVDHQPASSSLQRHIPSHHKAKVQRHLCMPSCPACPRLTGELREGVRPEHVAAPPAAAAALPQGTASLSPIQSARVAATEAQGGGWGGAGSYRRTFWGKRWLVPMDVFVKGLFSPKHKEEGKARSAGRSQGGCGGGERLVYALLVSSVEAVKKSTTLFKQ